DTTLDCNEDYSGNNYRDCEANLSYEVKTDYAGRAYLDVDVGCELEIEYRGRQTYTSQSDSDSENSSHSLYAYGRDKKSIDFSFSFNSFQEITKVKISEAVCKIRSVNLY
ncbi:MAG TPA: hypothetical protein VI140_03755, partial [Oxalicibacterium sp.]